MLGGRQWIISRVGHQQTTAEFVDKFELLCTQSLQFLTHLTKATVALDTLGNQVLIGGWDVHLTYRSRLGCGKKLRFMSPPIPAVASGVTALAYPRPEGATNQRAIFAQEEVKLVLVLLPSIEEALSQSARTLAHGLECIVADTSSQYVFVPAYRASAILGNALLDRPATSVVYRVVRSFWARVAKVLAVGCARGQGEISWAS